MTTPLLDPEQTELPWEKAEQRYQDIYKKQQEQDTIAASAESLPNDPYYQRLNIIRQDSATATAGEIAADETKKARIAAEKAAELARIQAAAQQAAYDGMNAIAAGADFGQPGSMMVGGGAYGAQGGTYQGWGSGGAQGVANVLRAAGFPESLVPTFMAIGMAESSWNPRATHMNSGGKYGGTIDQGLFQINTMHKGNSWYPSDPFDPLQSAKAALAIYKMQGLGAWSVYNSGAYRQYLPKSVPPIQQYVANTGSGMQQAQVGQAVSYAGVPGIYNGGNYGPINTKGLAGNATAARNFVTKTWGITNIGGFGGGSVSGSDHPKGKALDIMISNYKSTGGIAKGTEIANWFIANPRVFGVKYIIWRDRIWQNGVWKQYSHPSMKDDTGAHRDHVHVSFL